MSEDDRRRWDERHAGPSGPAEVALPSRFAPLAGLLPTAGRALELACGRGGTAVWLARRGLDVLAVDVSDVALRDATRLDPPPTCRFVRHDLDAGLPPGPPVDVLLCHRFRDPRLYGPMRDRLAAGGLLVVAVLSEVGADPGPFRAAPGELLDAFADLEVVEAGEGDGEAWLVARRSAAAGR